jgi:hypothetical protein
LLRPSFVRAKRLLDLRRVDQADGVPGLVQRQGETFAVAPRRLEAGVKLHDPEAVQPLAQLPPPGRLVGEHLGTLAPVPHERDVELPLGDIHAQPH